MHIPPASELILPTDEWLWPGYIALGNLVLTDGDPGLGKSLVTLDLCARLSTGRPFPDGAPGIEPSNVLLVCAEDPPGVILSRLRALGADLSRVFLWPRDQDGGLPRFPRDLPRLDAALAQTLARYVVLDPLMAFLETSVNLGSDPSVRAVLDGLTLCARRHKSAFHLIRHLNKQAGQVALYRGGGSIAFVAACRLAWFAGRHPRELDRFVLAQQKNNFGPTQPSLVYSVTEEGRGAREEGREARDEGREARDEAAGVSPRAPLPAPLAMPLAPVLSPLRVEWFGSCLVGAHELNRARARPRQLRAIAFWKEILKSGPRLAREVHAAADEEGISRSTLRLVKGELKIRCPRIFKNRMPLPYYVMGNQELPGAKGNPEVEAWLRSLDEGRTLGPS